VEYAREFGCFTACVTCVPDSAIAKAAEIAIVPVVGPEVITGSTRMKAGTAQKMVLNMISTVAMVRLGYVKGNRMTNVKPANEKLKDRGLRILMTETNLDEDSAGELMSRAEGDLRVAMVINRTGADLRDARTALTENDFVIERAVAALSGTKKESNA